MGLIDLWNRAKLYRLYQNARDNHEVLKTKEFWIEVYTTVWKIEEIRNMLKGIKSYLIAAVAAAVTIAHMLGYIDESTFQSLMALLGSGAVAAVAAKLNRATTQAQTNFNETTTNILTK